MTLHGMPAHSDMHRDHLAATADHFQVVTLCFRGGRWYCIQAQPHK